MFKPFVRTVILITLITLISGCGPAAPTATPLPPAATAEPTPTPQPTALPTPVPTATPLPGPTIEAPWSAAPVLDGTIAAGEWSAARHVDLANGGQALFMHDGSYLYLAMRVQGKLMGSPCLDRGDEVAILHSSAALGTATFRRDGESWVQSRHFSWRCRGTDNSTAAVRERQQFLQQEGWLASNSNMGAPNETEYQIAMPEGALRLALFYRQGPEFDTIFGWPAGLDDGCLEFELAQGEPKAPLSFSLERWVTITAGSPPTGTPVSPAHTNSGTSP